MSVTVETVKKYLRVDYDDEDGLLENLIEAAESYLHNAISDYDALYSTSEKFSAQADLLKTVLVGEMFFNRDGRNDQRRDYTYVVRSMINQLQLFAAGDAG